MVLTHSPALDSPALEPDALEADALALLHTLTGRPDATFRPGQLPAIRAVVADRQRALLVQRTGWGKSAVYFIATRLLRDRGAGPTLLVSPLLALMRNQIDAAERMGIDAVTINSTNTEDWDAVIDRLRAGTVDLLLISPERLANLDFRRHVLPEIGSRSGLLVVDEAHCISDWGHDFRPDYRRIVRVLDLLPAGVPVLCCTATANDRVVDDVVAQLVDGPHGDKLSVFRGPLGRDGLALQVIDLPSPAERLAWLATVVPRLEGSGIVYCLTVADTDHVARWLNGQGISALPYSGQGDHTDRIAAEEALLSNDVKVLAATSALGMGFDKPDLAFVIHYQAPSSAVAYYQQVGRAGRQLDESIGVLLRGREDEQIQDWFIDNAFPDREQAEAVLATLGEADRPMSASAIEAAVNLRRSRLSMLLKVLEVEGAIDAVKGGYQRTTNHWTYDDDRVESVTAIRRREQQEMRDYASTPGCRMAFLGAALDDPAREPCGICDRCIGAAVLEIAPDRALIAAATTFLKAAPITIDPRKQWPSGVEGVKGRLGHVATEGGRALCRYGDAGWGALVRQGRYSDGYYTDELVVAATAAIGGWKGLPRAGLWVAAVPSLRRPSLVPDFAAALATSLGVDFVACLEKACPTPEQRSQHNSAQQVRNLLHSFTVSGVHPVPEGPVLLVDDVVDSRWTLTVAGAVLREAGSGEVFPFALASVAGG